MKVVHINPAPTVKAEACKIVKLYPNRSAIMMAVHRKLENVPNLMA